jgi:hypothetical protein
MEMQSGSTIHHISQIFFLFAAPIYRRDWLAAPEQQGADDKLGQFLDQGI